MEIQPILNAVDIAIATAADKEFKRLYNETPKTNRHVNVVESVEKSLRSLGRLATGKMPNKMPNYDKWDALFYPAWYHSKQTNIVCSVLRCLRENGVDLGNEKLWNGDIFGIADGRARFIDFGCGSLAMQFAIAIAAADSISQGRVLREIRIDSYDPNPEMFEVGKEIWREFVHCMKCRYPRHPICKVFDLIQCETHDKLDTLPEATDAPYFLSAIHAVYEVSPVKNDLASLVAKYDPVGFLFTTHVSSRHLLRSMSPISEGAIYAKKSILNPKPRFNRKLDALTRWRRSLCDSLLDEPKLPPDTGIDTRFVRNLLKNLPVEWQYRDPKIVLYMRRDISEFTG